MEWEAGDAAPREAEAEPEPFGKVARSAKSKSYLGDAPQKEHPLKKRDYVKWQRDEEEAFFGVLKTSGRADLTRIAAVLPTKSKDQIRAYYHRVLRKVNHVLAPLTEAVDAYDGDDVRLALLSWWSMQRKQGNEASSAARPDARAKKTFERGLRDLVATNRRRLAQKRQAKSASGDRGAAAGAATTGPSGDAVAGGAAPGRPAASTAAASVAPRAPPPAWPRAAAGASGGGNADLSALPPHLTLQLFPVDDATLAAVAAAGWNPHLELSFRSRKTVASLLSHLASKWSGAPAQLRLGGDAALRLYAFDATSATPGGGWGAEAGAMLAADLMPSAPAAAAQQQPGVFHLKYGWTVQTAPAAAAAASPPAVAAPPAATAAPPAQAVASAPQQVTPGGLLSLLLENSQHGPPAGLSFGGRAGAAPTPAATTPATPAMAGGGAQHDAVQHTPPTAPASVRAAAPPEGGSFEALVRAWSAPTASHPQHPQQQQPQHAPPHALAHHSRGLRAGGCSLLPDTDSLFLGELSDAEHELLRDLHTSTSSRPPLPHQPHAVHPLPPPPHHGVDLGASLRGFSQLVPGGDGIGDIFLGIGSLLGVEPSWQAAPGGAGGCGGGSRLGGGGGGGGGAPASFAGICEVLRRA